MNCARIKKNGVEGYVVGHVHIAVGIRFTNLLNTNWAWYESKLCKGVSAEVLSHLLHLFCSCWLLGIWLNWTVNVWSHFIVQIFFLVRASLFILPVCSPSPPKKWMSLWWLPQWSATLPLLWKQFPFGESILLLLCNRGEVTKRCSINGQIEGLNVFQRVKDEYSVP